jgi:1-acyl-sn-glycerol-3-phosphate acyltransferase
MSSDAIQPVPLAPGAVRTRGSLLARAVLRGAGWRVEFQGLPAAQGVAVIYPHTSNWDFVVLLLAKWAIGLPVTFWGKDTLFRWPLFGRWLRWLGGLPVRRHTPQGAVGQMTDALRDAREQGRFMWLGLSPEGTRALTAGWRTGFYRVALGAGVPIGLVGLDYARRRVRFTSFWRPSGQPGADLALFAREFAGCRGHRPHLAAPVRLLENRDV